MSTDYIRKTNPVFESSFEAKYLEEYNAESYYDSVEYLSNENHYHFAAEFPQDDGNVCYSKMGLDNTKVRSLTIGGVNKHDIRRKN